MPTYEVTVKNGHGEDFESLIQLSDVVSIRKVDTGRIEHSFDVGDYALDSQEPTPSPEANTVEVVELIDKRADEFVIEDTGKTVAEHNPYHPPDEPVVAGVYPNMGDDRVWHFPESRLRRG